MSCIGSVLIFAIGFNLMFDKKVKVGNLLPPSSCRPCFPAFPFLPRAGYAVDMRPPRAGKIFVISAPSKGIIYERPFKSLAAGRLQL